MSINTFFFIQSMVCVTFVLARDSKGGIGRQGTLPWANTAESRADLKEFKRLTLGKTVIMGRKTWESLPKKPLPGRTNVVLTTDSSYKALGAHVVCHKEEWELDDDCVIIGGAQIYHLYENHPNIRWIITEIPGDWKCDTFYYLPSKAKLVSTNGNVRVYESISSRTRTHSGGLATEDSLVQPANTKRAVSSAGTSGSTPSRMIF
jgi:dihydrofolate reductase